jgi:tetratricopeptide (TPR) repeat protein
LRASGDAESARAEADPEAAERLRALGYVHGPGGRGSGADPKDKVEVARKIAAATGPFESPAQLVAVYCELAHLDPENPVVNVRLADALLRSGDAAASVPYFRRVVDGGARSADPYVGLATAYAQQGRLDDARGVLERALVADPSSGQAHFNLGEIARSRGESAEARAHYEAALRDATTRERAQARLSSEPAR